MAVLSPPMLVKGLYVVRGANLYYIMDARPAENLLLMENCWTCKLKWEPANIVRSNAKEVFKI